MDCELRYTADIPPPAHGVASAAAGFCPAVGLQRCMILAACLSDALRSVSAAVTTLFANHTHFAIRTARLSSDLIGGGSARKP